MAGSSLRLPKLDKLDADKDSMTSPFILMWSFHGLHLTFCHLDPSPMCSKFRSRCLTISRGEGAATASHSVLLGLRLKVWCWNGDCEALKLHGFSGWMILFTDIEWSHREGVTTGWSMEMPLTGPCATRRSPLNRGWVALFCIAGSWCHLFRCHKLRFDWSNPERASDFLCGVQTWLDKPYWLMRYSQKEPSNFFI